MRHSDETDAVFPHAYTFSGRFPAPRRGAGPRRREIDEALAATSTPTGAPPPAGESATARRHAVALVGIVHLGLRVHAPTCRRLPRRRWRPAANITGVLGVSAAPRRVRDAMRCAHGFRVHRWRSCDADASGQPRERRETIRLPSSACSSRRKIRVVPRSHRRAGDAHRQPDRHREGLPPPIRLIWSGPRRHVRRWAHRARPGAAASRAGWRRSRCSCDNLTS